MEFDNGARRNLVPKKKGDIKLLQSRTNSPRGKGFLLCKNTYIHIYLHKYLVSGIVLEELIFYFSFLSYLLPNQCVLFIF
jgi:hypothetical protein